MPRYLVTQCCVARWRGYTAGLEFFRNAWALRALHSRALSVITHLETAMKMRCIRTIRWDNCAGQMVVVARRGDIVDVTPCEYHEPGRWCDMESLYHEGITDIESLDNFEPISEPARCPSCHVVPDANGGCPCTPYEPDDDFPF